MPEQQAVMQKRKVVTTLAPLRQFFFRHGHIHVPNFPEYETLFDLCNKLRMSRSQLSSSVIEELDGMGFLWDLQLSNELRWYYHYAELKKFYDQFGHTRVPAKKGEYKSLGIWVLRQRRDEQVLPAKSKKLLNELGFEWSADIHHHKEQQWKAMFLKLEAFYKMNGHSNVSDGYRLDEKLGRWVSTVRSREDHLDDWKKKLLKTVKFKFRDDIRKDKEATRQALFRKLERFYNKHGHANVPETYSDSKLAVSVAYLRQYPERITPAEKKQLKEWKFLFSEEIKEGWERLWMKSYKKLEKFKAQHGHCRVSSVYKDQPLARWVATQRIDKNHDKLPLHREKMLRSIGFSFYEDIAALQEKKWMLTYIKLLRFKKIHGTTRVPESFVDKKLVYWVVHQRQVKKRMKFDRRKLLDKAGFVWRVK